MAQHWKDARREELAAQEEKIFDRRDDAEQRLNTLLGMTLTPSQFMQVRDIVATFERCEEGIDRVQEQMARLI